jgi:NAD(P)-dependent dehydrogenase (short-subunit alcohol dehydrogenase family)
MINERLAGKRVLVSGATRGIGLALAEAMARNEARVVISGRSADIEETAARLDGLAITIDLADPASIVCAIDQLPAVDVLANVAGTNLRKRFEDYTSEEIHSMFQINLFGPMRLTQAIG